MRILVVHEVNYLSKIIYEFQILPEILSILGHEVTIIDLFRASRHFGINVLAADQRELSERFARKNEDRFNGLQWQQGQTGVPLLPGVLAAIEEALAC